MGLLEKAIRKKSRPEKKKRPFAYLSASDVDVYLGSPEEKGAWKTFFDGFSRLSDFFSLGKALLFVWSDDEQKLELVTWSLCEPPPSFSISVESSLKVRLSVPLPQILLGAEQEVLRNFSACWVTKTSVPIAFPFTTPQKDIYGTLILLDAPVFDLEDEQFLACWKVLRDYVLGLLIPGELSPTLHGEATLQKILESGRQILALELPLTKIREHWVKNEEAPGPRIKELYNNLKELVGSYGATVSLPKALYSFYALKPPITAEVFLHQIGTLIDLPTSFQSSWNQYFFNNKKDVDEYLGKRGLVFP